MSGSVRLVLILLAVVFGAYILIHAVEFLVAKVLALLIPILVVAAVAVILYAVVNRKALGSGSRRILP
jgi:hypothetical protein